MHSFLAWQAGSRDIHPEFFGTVFPEPESFDTDPPLTLPVLPWKGTGVDRQKA